MIPLLRSPVTIPHAPVAGPLRLGEYRCAACGDIFLSSWSDEEADAESELLFGPLPPEERAVVCEDCFRAIYPRGAA